MTHFFKKKLNVFARQTPYEVDEMTDSTSRFFLVALSSTYIHT